MEIHTEDPKVRCNVLSTILRIARWLYGLLFLLALAGQIQSSLLTYSGTVNYDYFCGNPLMSSWVLWFVGSLIVGAFILPGGIWAVRHFKEWAGIAFLIGFVLYVLSVVLMLGVGVGFGTVPDFFNFIGYTFG
jgi:hypothetical protein